VSLAGVISGGVHRLPLRVYYEDTDFSGFVYHANYLKYCERARSDFLRLLGFDQTAMFVEGGAFVVRRMSCDFLLPAKFDNMLTVETIPGEATGARFELKQRVLREQDVLFAADVTAVLIDGKGRPRRLSPGMLQALARLSP
jgi:acyl-CoA thioester hydrolase